MAGGLKKTGVYLGLKRLKMIKLRYGESKSDSGEQAHTIAISFNFILGLIIACLWCLSFVG